MKHSKCIVKEVSLIRTKIEVSAQVNTKAKGSKKTKEKFLSVGGDGKHQKVTSSNDEKETYKPN